MSDHRETRPQPARTWRAAAGAVALAAATAAGTTVLAGCGGTATPKGAQAARVAKQASPAAAATRDSAVATIAKLLQIGIGQAERKNWSAARTTFGDVLAIAPDDVYALYNLGLVDQSLGATAAADGYYDRAIADDATYTPALYNLAISLESSDPGKALALYQKIVSINPQASTAYLRMAFVYAEQGDRQQAASARAKAIAIDPSLGTYALPAAK